MHSPLAPSSADRWVECPGSILMASMYPEPDTQATLEGEASHQVVRDVLRSWQQTEGSLLDAKSLVGKQAENGVMIDEEMVEAARVMIDEVLEISQEKGLLSHLHIEEQLDLSMIHPLMYGTPDVWAMKNGAIYQWDYKYGHLAIPANSWQNKAYVRGILATSNESSLDYRVRMAIVQPRCYSPEGPVKTATMAASDLRADWNRLEAATIDAMRPDAPVNSGPWCRYCPARHECPAARKAAYNAIDVVDSAVPDNITNQGISFELQLLERCRKALDHRYEAIQTEAIQRLQAGQIVNGYVIKMGQGNRAWKSLDDLKSLPAFAGLPDLQIVEEKPLTPAKVEQQIKAINRERDKDNKVDVQILSAFVTRPETGLKLVPTDDSVAAKVFKRQE